MTRLYPCRGKLSDGLVWSLMASVQQQRKANSYGERNRGRGVTGLGS